MIQNTYRICPNKSQFGLVHQNKDESFETAQQ